MERHLLSVRKADFFSDSVWHPFSAKAVVQKDFTRVANSLQCYRRLSLRPESDGLYFSNIAEFYGFQCRDAVTSDAHRIDGPEFEYLS